MAHLIPIELDVARTLVKTFSIHNLRVKIIVMRDSRVRLLRACLKHRPRLPRRLAGAVVRC